VIINTGVRSLCFPTLPENDAAGGLLPEFLQLGAASKTVHHRYYGIQQDNIWLEVLVDR